MDDVDQILAKYNKAGGGIQPQAEPDQVDAILNKYKPPSPEPSWGDKARATVEGFGGNPLSYVRAQHLALMPDPTLMEDNWLRSKGVKISQPEWNDADARYAQDQAQMAQDKKDMPGPYQAGEDLPLDLATAAATGTASSGLLQAGRAVGPGLLQGAKAAYNSPITQKALDLAKQWGPTVTSILFRNH